MTHGQQCSLASSFAAVLRSMLGGYRVATAVAFLAIAARVAVQLAAGFYEAPETWEEGEIALRLVRGDGYSYEINGTTAHALRGPTYAFMLAGAYVLFGATPVVAGLLQALLGGALAVVCYALARRWAGMLSAALAGTAVALYPPLLVYASKIHQLNLDVLLVAFVVLLLVRADAQSGTRGGALLGLVAGMATLSRATFAPLFGIPATILVVRAGRSGLRYGATVLLAAAVVTTPWALRNQLTLGEATLSTTTGYLLWIGNNPQATGSTLTTDGRPILEAAPTVRNRIWGLDEQEQDRIFMGLALAYMTEDIPRTAAGFARKLWSFWWFGPTAGASYPRAWLTLYMFGYTAVLVAAAAGTIWALRQRDRWPLIVVTSALISVSLLQSIFYVDGRHRWAVEPLLLVLAAIGVAKFARRWARGRFGRIRRLVDHGFRGGGHKERTQPILER